MVLRALFYGEPINLLDFDRDDITILRRDHEKALRHGEHLLACPNCAGNVHPVRYGWGLDILAHDPGQGHTCAIARGESARHDSLKRLIAGAADRVKGWTADVEVPGDGVDPDTGRPPIVDVVASRETPLPFERPFGWEAQLSPASDASILNRQEVRDLFLERCSWVTPGRPAWRYQVPWLGIGDDPGTTMVVDGIVVDTGADYQPGEPEPLTARRRRHAPPRRPPTAMGARALPVGRDQRPGQQRLLPARRSRGAPSRRAPAHVTVGPAISQPTVNCEHDPIESRTHDSNAGNPAPARAQPTPRFWRPVPNRPDTVQLGEAGLICPGCGQHAINHPESIAGSGKPWWCQKCLNARIRQARQTTSTTTKEEP